MGGTVPNQQNIQNMAQSQSGKGYPQVGQAQQSQGGIATPTGYPSQQRTQAVPQAQQSMPTITGQPSSNASGTQQQTQQQQIQQQIQQRNMQQDNGMIQQRLQNQTRQTPTPQAQGSAKGGQPQQQMQQKKQMQERKY